MKKTFPKILIITVRIIEYFSCFLLGFLSACYFLNDEENYGNENKYTYPHENYLNTESYNIQHYHCFSKGLTINGTDVYELSCNIIESAVQSPDTMLNGINENIDVDMYSDLRKSLIQEDYIDNSFAYDIIGIDYYDDKVKVEFIYCYDYSLNEEICHADANNFPAYLYMKYNKDAWIVEYIDFYEHG